MGVLVMRLEWGQGRLDLRTSRKKKQPRHIPLALLPCFQILPSLGKENGVFAMRFPAFLEHKGSDSDWFNPRVGAGLGLGTCFSGLHVRKCPCNCTPRFWATSLQYYWSNSMDSRVVKSWMCTWNHCDCTRIADKSHASSWMHSRSFAHTISPLL